MLPLEGVLELGMSRWSPNYSMACTIQRKLLAMMDSGKTGPSQLATLSNAWEKLEERKRILRMKPKPRDVEVKPKEKRLPQQSFQE